MALPFVSLNAASATGPGASRDLEEVSSHHTMIVSTTGTPNPATVDLEGSHDNSVWVSLGGINVFGTPVSVTVPQSASPTFAGVLVRFIRANLTALSGGSSPTVTATIASDVDEED